MGSVGKVIGIVFVTLLACWGVIACVVFAFTSVLGVDAAMGGALLEPLWDEVGQSTDVTIYWSLSGYSGEWSGVDGLPVSYPVKYYYGFSPEYFEGRFYHTGVDMPCPEGTPVTTMIGGEVTHAGPTAEGYGVLVIVENDTVQSFYGHLGAVTVSVGDVIDAGTLVGASGNTGASTGPHLHWEVRVMGQSVDPLGDEWR